MVKFKIKEGHPKMSVFHEGKKYVLWDWQDKGLPDEVFKSIKDKKHYGIIETKEKKDGSNRSE